MDTDQSLHDPTSGYQNGRLVGDIGPSSYRGQYGSTRGRARTPVTSPSGPVAYEEFFGGDIPCPSCRGVGRIPRDKENELVALIPMSDKRLKPRRTVLYVLLAVLVCLLIGGLLAYFLFPRGVKLMSNSPSLKPEYLYVNTTEEFVDMRIRNEYNITNSNYYSVDITKLSATLLFDQRVLTESENTTLLKVPLRSTVTHYISFNVTFSGDEGYIAHYCGSGIRRPHSLLMPFEATLLSHYFGGQSENSLTTYQHVRCTNLKQ